MVAPYTMLRPIEIASAEWEHIDLETKLFRIPEDKMKTLSMENIANGLKTDTALNNNTINFVKKSSFPVFALLKSAYSVNETYGDNLRFNILPVVAASYVYEPMAAIGSNILLALDDIESQQMTNEIYGENNMATRQYKEDVLRSYGDIRGMYIQHVTQYQMLWNVLASINEQEEAAFDTIRGRETETGRYAGQDSLSWVDAARAQSTVIYGNDSRIQDIMENKKTNNGKLVADAEMTNQLQNAGFDVKQGDILDFKVGAEGNIEQLTATGTKDGLDYTRTFGAEGQLATDMQTAKTGTAKEWSDIDIRNVDHSHSQKYGNYYQDLQQRHTGKDYQKKDIDNYSLDHSSSEKHGTYYQNMDKSDVGRMHNRHDIDRYTVDHTDNVTDGTNYKNALQGVMRGDSDAVKDRNRAVDNYQAAVADYEEKKTEFDRLPQSYNNPEMLEELVAASRKVKSTEGIMNSKDYELTKSLTHDIGEFLEHRSAEEKAGRFTYGGSASIRGEASASFSKGEGMSIGNRESAGDSVVSKVLSKTGNFGARITGSAEGRVGYDKVNASTEAISNNEIFNDISSIVKATKESPNKEQEIYKQINDYLVEKAGIELDEFKNYLDEKAENIKTNVGNKTGFNDK